MQRRELFPILGLGIAGLAQAAPRWLTAAEFATLDQLCELLIPADESGPGAREAGVANYIDLTLQYADETLRAQWRSGLAAVESLAQAEFAKGFAACGPAEQAQLMDRMASGEQQPESATERFFVLLKNASIQGFAWSEAGRKALGYRGDVMIAAFTGCTHPDRHQG